ncbi:glycosyltransferase family 2 protein [Tetragenococcus halophilus]|uniref:glycosyltransferase family 2 protein n=1 Tax=Tetragenococcus halophilus TaxID=51669 RepID=UPI0021BA9D0B|nr:glycosyltransferase family 2 protein [Tetragenococcus halophilus]MDN6268745.1 glycosyltransferase [Tetragenococcus koreensis]MDN6572496.1 glycosyltransferase [Staphylococcus equorum]
MEEPLISIIMPAYNSEKYIAESILSVIAQQYLNWELIVIDDSSLDNTVNIVREFADKDSRIKLFINKNNFGVAKARNKGIDVSSGEWLAFLDSDDIWQKEKLSKQFEVIVKETAGFVFTGVEYINEEGKPFKGNHEIPQKVSYKELKRHNAIACSSVLLKKEYFANLRMRTGNLHEDYATWLEILKNGKTAYGVNEPLLVYRLYRSSRSGNKLKTFVMTYNAFRAVDIGALSAVYYTICHVLASVNKYSKILT